MKKSFSVFTLVMLLAVQILTPVTYAVGDEEFVEESIVQEETPEDVEEVSDDVDDETEDVDLDEEEDEDSLSEEEDSFSGDVVDEDSLEMSWDVISDAETESWDVVVIDSESWAVAATGSEVAVESIVDVSWTSGVAWTSESSVTVDDEFITKLSKQWSVAKIAEELGINWYTDSSEWAIKAWIEWKYLWTKEQNNIIREYFIDHAREILWAEKDVVEESENVEEIPEVVELNKEEISGKKYSNWVTVSVLAPINTFPEGTTLSIVPIKTKKDLKEIKEQLVEQQDEVTEESNVVAFDISFLYSWEEVQPVSWQTVQVTFNYGNHEKLSEANEDEEQELKVYHLNDKDGSGNKVEDISEVKVEAVDIVKNEEWELVVDAESFSVYTIVTQVAEEGPDALEDQLANFEYGMISIARPDSITAEWNPEWFTIMDRNLGALEVWTWDNSKAYWYHYQWGNNYGFNSIWDLSAGNKTWIKIDVSWSSTYSWNQFVWWESNSTWMSGSNNNDLWNWENRQWPCPDWWHVPTIEEWNQLLIYYAWYYTWNNMWDISLEWNPYKYVSWNSVFGSWFYNYFQIPFAGDRYYADAEVQHQGVGANLWSSTPCDENAACNFYLSSSRVSADYYGRRANGFSVRCFKDDYVDVNSNVHTITFYFNGWSWSTAAINVISWEKAIEPEVPIKEWYIFDGWYESSTFEWDKFDFEETDITLDKTLYAKWIDMSDAAVLLPGQEFNKIIKVLAPHNWDETWITYNSDNGNITAIVKFEWDSDNLPDSKRLISDVNLGSEVWAWYDDWKIYYYTNASRIYLNKDASSMFRNLKGINNLDLSDFDFSMAESLYAMFENTNFQSIVFPNDIDTSSVTNMWYMFAYSNNLVNLDVSKFDTSNVTNMEYMFSSLYNIQSLNLSNFDTSMVINMFAMFQNLKSLENLDITNFDMTNVKDMNYMFNSSKFKKIILDWLNLSGVTSSIDSTFDWLEDLEEISFSWVIFPQKSTSMYGFFDSRTKLTKVNFYKADFNWVNSISNLLAWDSKLETVNFSWANLRNVTNIDELFSHDSSLQVVDFTNVTFWNLTSMRMVFDWCTSLENIDLNSFDTVNVSDMFGLFRGCSNLKELDLTNFDTHNLSNANQMFEAADKLKTVYVSDKFENDLFLNVSLFYRATSIVWWYWLLYDWSNVKWNRAQINTSTQEWYFTDPNNFAVAYYTKGATPTLMTLEWNKKRGDNPDWLTSDHEIYQYYTWKNETTPVTLDTVDLQAYTELYVDVACDSDDYWLIWTTCYEKYPISVAWSWSTIKVTSTMKAKYLSGENVTLTFEWTPDGNITWSSIPSVAITSTNSWHSISFVMPYSNLTLTPTISVYHKVTYHASANGWTTSDFIREKLVEWDSVNLELTASKTNYSFEWWNTTQNSHATLSTLTMWAADIDLYPIFKKQITITFSWNNNKLYSWETQVDVIEGTCDRYNNEPTCNVVVPKIVENPITQIISWYSENSADNSAIATIWTVTLNSWAIAAWTTPISVSENKIYYAQTVQPAVTINVSYVKWEWADATAVSQISPTAQSCTIVALYNGNRANNWEPQATTCTLKVPEVYTYQWYEWYIAWLQDKQKWDDYEETVWTTERKAYATGEHYGITYVLWENGTWPVNTTVKETYQEWETYILPTPVRKGYKFEWWTVWAGTNPTLEMEIVSTDKWSKTFVAHWLKTDYLIIYTDIEPWTTGLPTMYSYNTETTIGTPNKIRRGYDFTWWRESGTTANPTVSVTIPVHTIWDKYYTAVWTPKNYTITTHLNGWTVDNSNTYSETYTVEREDFVLKQPTRANSEFLWWTGTNRTSPDKNVTIQNGSIGDKTYYAVYTCKEWYEENTQWACVEKPYSVSYVIWEGKHSHWIPQGTVTIDENNKYQITVYNPIQTGYNFMWWNINIPNYTCKVDSTTLEQWVACKWKTNKPLIIEFDQWQQVTLTAIWEHVKVNVKTVVDTVETTNAYSYNGEVNLNATNKVGYEIKWWSATSADWPAVYANNLSKKISELTSITYPAPTEETGGTWAVTLYAVYERIDYNIQYNANGGERPTNPSNPTTYNVTNGEVSLYDPIRTWYDFQGWYTQWGDKVEKLTPTLVGWLEGKTLILKAEWTASTDTDFTVLHEKQWLDGKYYSWNSERTVTEHFKWETDTTATPAISWYVGFISPINQKSAKIKADGSTVIEYEYQREKNTYKYNTVVWATTAWKTQLANSWSTVATSEQMYYDMEITLSWRANTWYAWSWWDVTIWTETTRIEWTNDNHEYTIIMPLTNVEVTPVVYHIPYTLTYNVNGWTGNETELQEVSPIYYDSGITYPVVTRTGYSFQWWYDDNGTQDESDDVYYGSGDDINNKNMPNKNLNLVAHWSANPFVLKVNHYQMDLTGNYPTQPTKEVLIDTTIDADITSWNNANILPETYTGFTLSWDAVESIHINPDGTTKIDYYYIRDKHNVTVNTNEWVTLSGTLSWSYYYQTPVSVEAIINEWYTWSWWNVTTGENEPVFTTDTWVSFILWTGNVILTPLTTTNSYHLTIKNDWTLVFSWDVLYKTNISQYLTTPSKAGYTFNGWSNRPVNDLMPAKDLVIEAKWTYKSNGWGGGGWGGSSSSDDKKVIINNTWDKQQEHSSTDLTGTNLTGTNKDLKENEVKEEQSEKAITDMNFDELKNLSADKLKKVDRTKLTKEENEILDAYEWAYEHNVTTMVTLNDANPEWIVTRGHLAKMVVNYAINVLWQQLPEKVPSECRWNDWRGDWESDEIKDYAVKACSLWLMWLDMKKFSPKLRVTRAQFGTIMSRLLWWKKYAWGTPYYRKHLNALKLNNIMTQIWNPEWRVELRQWVWLMLMRAAMDKNV